MDNIESYYKQLLRKQQEYEELKKYKDIVENLAGKQIILTNKDKMPELYENAKDLKLDRYKQALENIKKISTHCKSQDICTLCQYADKCKDKNEYTVYDSNNLILNIINEVKD